MIEDARPMLDKTALPPVVARHADDLRGRGLVLFDGLCRMCHATVRTLLANDPAGRLRFTPLEGALGQAMLRRHPHLFPPTTELTAAGKPARVSAQTVVVMLDCLTGAERVYTRSDASIAAMRRLRPPWPLAARLLALVPRFVRDAVYRVVARLRYPLFGRYAACPPPAAAERGRMLAD